MDTDLPGGDQRPVVPARVDQRRVAGVAEVVGEHPGPRRRCHEGSAGGGVVDLGPDHDRAVAGQQQLRLADPVQRGDAEPARLGPTDVVGLQGATADPAPAGHPRPWRGPARRRRPPGRSCPCRCRSRCPGRGSSGIPRSPRPHPPAEPRRAHRRYLPAPRRDPVETVLDVPLSEAVARQAAVQTGGGELERRLPVVPGVRDQEPGGERGGHREQHGDGGDDPAKRGSEGHGHQTAALAEGFPGLGRWIA